MRVLFLSSYSPYAASTRYRVTQFLPHLERLGIACELLTLMSQEFFERFYEPGRILSKGAYPGGAIAARPLGCDSPAVL